MPLNLDNYYFSRDIKNYNSSSEYSIDESSWYIRPNITSLYDLDTQEYQDSLKRIQTSVYPMRLAKLLNSHKDTNGEFVLDHGIEQGYISYEQDGLQVVNPYIPAQDFADV